MFLPRNSFFNDSFELFNNKEENLMKADVYEKESNYYIKIDIPGVKKEDINISYDKGYLHISAIKKEETEQTDNYIRKERFYGEVTRTFYVGDINEDHIKANYTDGILTLSFPQEQPRQSKRQITIE